jgi:glycosyltransferase involved in cell wall biosynthesis
MSAQSKPVLLIAHYFPPHTATGGARPYRFFKYLPESGFEPWVITASPQDSGHPRIVYVPARQADKKSLTGIAESFLRKFVFPCDESVLWANAAAKKAKQLVRERPFAAVISTFPSIGTHLAAAALHSATGIPWLADYRDPLSGNPFRPSAGLSALTDRRLERTFMAKASAVTMVTDTMRDQLAARYKRDEAKIHVLWNGYDPEHQTGPEPIPTRPHRVLTHTGSLYWPRHAGILFESMRRLLESGRLTRGSVVIRQVGLVDPKIVAAQASVFEYLQNAGALELAGMLPKAEAHREQSQADFLLLIDTTDKGGYTVPAKIFEYISVGRPILALTDEGSPVQRILAQAGIPYRYLGSTHSPDRVDAAVLDFLKTPSDVTQPSNAYRDTFDGRLQAATLAGILRNII